MLKLSRPNISEEAIAAVADVLRSGNLVHGPENEAFEQDLARYLGCSDVVLVSSGTAALHVALMALDIGPGDAVLLPDFTFPATGNVINLMGARPVLVDVLPGTYNLDPDALRDVIAQWQGPERLRAIMPVHEFGCPADMAAINAVAQEHGLFVVEDAACALGAEMDGQKAGTLGTVGCFSFHPRKTLTTGEGGAIATNDAKLAARLRRLRNHGMERDARGLTFIESSTNYRLTQFQAVLGRHQLPHLDQWIAKRRSLVEEYVAGLPGNALALPDLSKGHSWQTFMVVLPNGVDRSQVIKLLNAQGIESNLGAQSLSSIGLYGSPDAEVVVGSKLARQGLALPLYEEMSRADVAQVCSAIKQVLQTIG